SCVNLSASSPMKTSAKLFFRSLIEPAAPSTALAKTWRTGSTTPWITSAAATSAVLRPSCFSSAWLSPSHSTSTPSPPLCTSGTTLFSATRCSSRNSQPLPRVASALPPAAMPLPTLTSNERNSSAQRSSSATLIPNRLCPSAGPSTQGGCG